MMKSRFLLRWQLWICKFCGFDPRNLANSFLGFPRISRRDSLARIGWRDATEAAQDDEIGRSVPRTVGSDHQYEARTGAASRQARLGLARQRDCAAPACVIRISWESAIAAAVGGPTKV